MKKILMCLLLASVSVFGITHPTVSKFDKRITYTKYNAEDVFIIKAKVGYVSMVRFNEDEKVVVLSSGFSNGWEIIDVDNMLFVKPIVYNVKTAEQETITGSDGKPVKLSTIIQPTPQDWKTNLIVVTNRRTYAFDLELVEDSEDTKVSNDYTLTFAYNEQELNKSLDNKAITEKYENSVDKNKALKEEAKLREEAMKQIAKEEAKAKEIKETIEYELSKTTVPVNYDYVMHINKESEKIAPDFVYDDGMFTYIGFRRAKDIPSVFSYTDENGKPYESIVPKHMKRYSKFNVIVVHKLMDRILLRSGERLVGVKNNGFGKNEIDDLRTTKSLKVDRKIKPKDEGEAPVKLQDIKQGEIIDYGKQR